jgi:hypothetical protein
MNPIIEWLDQLCQEALDAAHKGDTGLANRLGRSFALKYYFDNVFSTRAVSRPTFQAMVNYMTEAERVYNEVKADELREAKEAARDAEIAELKTGLAEVLKLLTESKADPAPTKGKGKKVAAEAEEEAE